MSQHSASPEQAVRMMQIIAGALVIVLELLCRLAVELAAHVWFDGVVTFFHRLSGSRDEQETDDA